MNRVRLTHYTCMECPNCKKKVVGTGFIFKDEEEKILLKRFGRFYGILSAEGNIPPVGYSLLKLKDKDKETIEFTFRCRNCGEKWSQDIPYYGELGELR